MPSRTTILALVAGLLALLLAPQLGSSSMSQAAIIAAPVKYVREKSLDYDFIREIQKPNNTATLDAIMLVRDPHKMSAFVSLKYEFLEVRNVGPPRAAKVVSNNPGRFIYREESQYGQAIVHTLRFEHVGHRETKFEYEKTWRGSVALLVLGKFGMLRPAGGGVDRAWFEGFKTAVEDGYDEEFSAWGHGRYD